MKILRPGLGRCLVMASALLSLTGAAWADEMSVTVYGQNDHTVDVDAVQHALNDHSFDTVILDGTFNFGEGGGVQITRPDMTLKGPAIIRGGGKQIVHDWIWWWWYTIEVSAVNTTVENITFEDPIDAAILINITDPGNGYVDITDNSVTDCWAGFAALHPIDTSGEDVHVNIRNNSISECVFGILMNEWSVPYTYTMNIRENRIENIYEDGIRLFSVAAPVNIIDNYMANLVWSGIWIGSWSLVGEPDPEFGDNPPVKIIGNTFDMDSLNAAGIMVGTSGSGINDVLVKNNVLRGVVGYGGLMKQPYGHDNRFIGNDLSELTSYGPQIFVTGGRNNLFFNNKLGKTEAWDIDWLFGGIVEETAAILSSTANWHLNDANTPDPVNFDNVFIANDFRATGLPGWDDAYPDNAGGVLLLDFIQTYSADFSEAYENPFTTENIVIELGKFPRIDGKKTRVCTQVRDMSNLYPDDMVPGTNHVAGWRLCERAAMDDDDDSDSD